MPKTDAVLTACALCLVAAAASAAEPVDVAVRAGRPEGVERDVVGLQTVELLLERGHVLRPPVVGEVLEAHLLHHRRSFLRAAFLCVEGHDAPGYEVVAAEQILCPHADSLLGSFANRGLQPSFWVMIGAPDGLDQAAKVKHAAAALRPLAEAAAKAGCRVDIYNHGGWGGEPENQIAVIEELKLPNVGIVYNQHHGHDHLPRFKELLAKMRPHLRCLNINGMTADGDKKGKKILVLGQGDLDVQLARTICESGYAGPIGILGHTQDDAEARLLDNLEGLDWVVAELTGKPVPKPVPRTK